jgi:hypothetical protein
LGSTVNSSPVAVWTTTSVWPFGVASMPLTLNAGGGRYWRSPLSDGLHGSQRSVSCDRDAVEERVDGIGEVGPVLRHDHVVDEGRRLARQLKARDVFTGGRVVDVAVSRDPSGDEQAVALVEVDSDCVPARVGLYEQGPLA